MTPWHTGRMCAFDLETTGLDTETARIVTACVALVGGGQPAQRSTWLADPGIDIPAEASAVHGITTEQARAEGSPAVEVVKAITEVLAGAVAEGVPVVALNARYDLTTLDRECRRHGVLPLVDDVVAPQLRVIDPFVIDKALDPYRRGKRTLTALCEHYRVQLDGAHDAGADAVAAARVAWRQGQISRLAAMSLDELHEAQVGWAADQAASLAAYFQRTPGKEHQAAEVRGEWPLVPFKSGEEV